MNLAQTLLVALSLTCTACEVYYIKPHIEHKCLIQPCYTLNEFSILTGRNLSKHLSLRFLPGNHSLALDLFIGYKDMLSVSSQNNNSWVVCQQPQDVQLLNITMVEMRNMTFLGCGGIKLGYVQKFIAKSCFFLHSQFFNARSIVYAAVILALGSVIELNHNKFIDNNNGSIIAATECNVTDTNSVYINNKAHILIVDKSIVRLHKCIFRNNVAIQNAFVLANMSTILILENWWENNSFEKNSTDTLSAIFFCTGCIFFQMKDTTITHTHSYAMGGILIAVYSNITINNCNISHNYGKNYTLFIRYGNISSSNTTWAHNAVVHQDFIVIIDCKITKFYNLKLTQNKGNFKILRSSAIFAERTVFTYNIGSMIIMNSVVDFCGINHISASQFTKASQRGGAVLSQRSTLTFYGTTYLIDNYSKDVGGALYAAASKLQIYGTAIIANNTAEVSGGGVYLDQSEFWCHFSCIIYQNQAHQKGGGIHAQSSKIAAEVEFSMNFKEGQQRYLLFAGNRARLGGAICLDKNSKLSLLDNGLSSEYNISFVENMAEYGGAVYIDDYHSDMDMCGSQYYLSHSTKTECFLLAFADQEKKIIHFSRNLAINSGSAIFGGLLDRCTVDATYTGDIFDVVYSRQQKPSSGFSYLAALSNIIPVLVSSQPVRLCYCKNNHVNCDYDHHSVFIQRGENLFLTLAAVDQANNTVNATIRTITSSVKEFDSVKHSYNMLNVCTEIEIRLSTFPEPKTLVLYAVGPCNNTGISQRIIKIQYSKCICPIGFHPSERTDLCECICDTRLLKYVKTCILKTKSVIRETNAWIGYINSTTSTGYLVYPNCPLDYCKPGNPSISINLNIPNGSDSMCVRHRTGILCGRCKPAFSLSLGGTKCLVCPNHWPGLLVANLLAQAFTGIILIGLILWFDLTVAVGTFNGLFFYANVVAANKSNFLPFSKLNILTIFISFLNLESGIDRCHIKGMDAYLHTWMSLIFPIYIIFLVVTVIFISRCSSLFSRVIATGNPVAALATLILLSYTRILHTIIKILSFAILNYPDGSVQAVWLPDASVSYLRGKHIALFLVALIIIIIGVIYTILLFSWQWLLRAPHKRVFLWIRDTRVNSFMDAYLAPHTVNHRYWTGLLLFVRVLLYLLSAVNMNGDPKFNFLVIGGIMTSLMLLQLYSRNRIYKSRVVDRFETTANINLLIFTLGSFYSIGDKNRQRNVACVSTSVAFVMFVIAFLYHAFLGLRKLQCLNAVVKFLKRRLQVNKADFDHSLKVDLIDNTDSGMVCSPTTTVVGMSELHSFVDSSKLDPAISV